MIRLEPRLTIRVRLTLWYSGLFLASGAALLAVTYGLLVQAFRGHPAPTAACRSPGSGCHVISTSQAQAVALQAHSAVINALLARSALALAVMTALSVGLGWFLAGRALQPLEATLADQRQFIANAAHELRTPLARQRVISQVALADPGATADSLRAAHERVLASGAEQQQLIDALLTLARGQAGLETRQPFDLAAVTRQVLSARQAEADGRNLTLTAALTPAPVAGSPHLAGQLVANLVDNGLRHNAPGGRVQVSTGTADSRAILSVSNTGPVVPAAAVDRLFQPFRTLAADRTGGEGLGLGLSIVQAVAQAHGATIAASPQPEGGLRIQVSFPRSVLSGP